MPIHFRKQLVHLGFLLSTLASCVPVQIALPSGQIVNTLEWDGDVALLRAGVGILGPAHPLVGFLRHVIVGGYRFVAPETTPGEDEPWVFTAVAWPYTTKDVDIGNWHRMALYIPRDIDELHYNPGPMSLADIAAALERTLSLSNAPMCVRFHVPYDPVRNRPDYSHAQFRTSPGNRQYPDTDRSERLDAEPAVLITEGRIWTGPVGITIYQDVMLRTFQQKGILSPLMQDTLIPLAMLQDAIDLLPENLVGDQIQVRQAGGCLEIDWQSGTRLAMTFRISPPILQGAEWRTMLPHIVPGQDVMAMGTNTPVNLNLKAVLSGLVEAYKATFRAPAAE